MQHAFSLFFRCSDPQRSLSEYVSRAYFFIPSKKKFWIYKPGERLLDGLGGTTHKPIKAVLTVKWQRWLKRKEEMRVFHVSIEAGETTHPLEFRARQ